MTDESVKKGIDIEEVLDKQFPKGDKARGRALVLFAYAKLAVQHAREKITNEIFKDIKGFKNKDTPKAYVLWDWEFKKLKRKYLNQTGGKKWHFGKKMIVWFQGQER